MYVEIMRQICCHKIHSCETTKIFVPSSITLVSRLILQTINCDKVTKVIQRERYADRKLSDKIADEAFIQAIWQYFGENEFERGNLDAGRLSWVFGREIKPVGLTFDPMSYEAVLRLDKSVSIDSFPRIFETLDV